MMTQHDIASRILDFLEIMGDDGAGDIEVYLANTLPPSVSDWTFFEAWRLVGRPIY